MSQADTVGTMAAPPARTLKKRAIVAITVGNALEFYDFVVYSMLATLMARLFFPFENDPMLSLLLSFAVFGTGFVIRPLGGIIIGIYADRHGRRSALRLTLWLMALGSALFVVAPTYAQYGMIGPIVVLLARLIQGFAVGGQVGAATTMLMEYADNHSRGYYCSFQLLSQLAGNLVGMSLVFLLSNTLTADAMDSWGWRLMFAIGVITIPIGEYIRHRLEETAEVPDKHVKEAPSEVEKRLFRQYWREIVAGILLIIGGTAPHFIINLYMANHAVMMFGIPLGTAMGAATFATLVQMCLITYAGRLSDRVGRKKVVTYGRVVLLVTIFPAFWVLHHYPSITMLATIMSLLSIPLAFSSTPTFAQLPELFPRRIRASGMSIVYCFGVMVFGGFAQFIVTGLVKLTGNPYSPAFYVVACILLSLVGVAMVKETAGKSLD